MNLSTPLGIITGILITSAFFMLFHLVEINVKLEKIENHLFKMQSYTLTLTDKE